MKWQRMLYQPVLPLGEDGKRVTGSKEHIALSRKAASEGMVLMKNEGQALPLKKGERIALFGKGTIDYVKGGGGSGDVTVAYIRNLYEGMKIKESEGKVSVFHELANFYEENIKEQFEQGAQPGMTVEPEVPQELVTRAKAFTDTAIISICRFSGEGWDRHVKLENESDLNGGYDVVEGETQQRELSDSVFEDSDYYLTKAEKNMVEVVAENFQKVIVVLNVGGMVDTIWFKDRSDIQAALLALQGGMEGGLAMADVLCGDVNPSGKLVDTFAKELKDYPSTANFHESATYVNYTEDIYVGYRYFETIPGAADKVAYPFGYGLSYTKFDVSVKEVEQSEDIIHVSVEVTNTGDVAGKEVVQLYYSAPQGKLGKPAKELGAYRKTKLLQPGETQTVELSMPVVQMASYDDLGKVCMSAYVLEPGTYKFYVGTSVRDVVETAYTYEVTDVIVTMQLTKQGAPHKLPERMLSDGTLEELPMDEPVEDPGLDRLAIQDTDGVAPRVVGVPAYFLWGDKKPAEKPQFSMVAEGKMSLDEFMDHLSDEDMIHLLGGQPNTGVANTWGMGNLPAYGIPNVMTADGPAGLRIQPQCGVNTTAWPCATLLASTFDPELIEAVGAAGALEVKENNIGLWLTPGVNIHRSPLCGRNFEYYSEDPYVTGKAGAAMVKGIQSRHIGASVKHFCCNNKETNRKDSDSRVSERALREIYLKAFEMIVKEANPYTIMSSYNLVNGVQTSENKELLTNILRGEWGFEGMVTTDWWTQGEHYRETKAGNDIKMACGFPERVKEALEKGYISREEIRICARRILQMILKMD
ncbi:MAG: glycoside hydrolase family 3 C-terminal domain-containing protein [Lachnospiraceae bacterium]|nr:glycoside hydrolase family 3 C-terminal domain-containing protein [Lachnospiraceae bacterium]